MISKQYHQIFNIKYVDTIISNRSCLHTVSRVIEISKYMLTIFKTRKNIYKSDKSVEYPYQPELNIEKNISNLNRMIREEEIVICISLFLEKLLIIITNYYKLIDNLVNQNKYYNNF